MNNKEEKDIYQLLNEVEFDITDQKEIELNDIEKKRLKKNILSKINKKSNRGISKKKITVAIAAFTFIVTLVSPIGQKAIAAIKNRFFFNPGLGIMESNGSEAYILDLPISKTIGGNNVVIKSVMSSEGYVELQLNITGPNLEDLKKRELEGKDSNLKFIDTDGKVINGEFKFAQMGSATDNDIIKELVFRQRFVVDKIYDTISFEFFGDKIEKIKLSKVKDFNIIENIGSNSEVKGISLGVAKYIFGGKTYLNFWSQQEIADSEDIWTTIPDYGAKNIHAYDKDGKEYKVEQVRLSNKEFVINEEVKGPLTIKVDKVNVVQKLKDNVEVELDMPKEGETLQVDKEVYIKELDQKIIINTINDNARLNRITIFYDKVSKNKENTEIYGVYFNRGNSAIGNDVNIEKQELSSEEIAMGKVKLYINRVQVSYKGEWKFTIE